jgi:hypothetical protein
LKNKNQVAGKARGYRIFWTLFKRCVEICQAEVLEDLAAVGVKHPQIIPLLRGKCLGLKVLAAARFPSFSANN